MYQFSTKYFGKCPAGFTLIELVLALAMSTALLGLVGSGLVIVTKQDRAAAADRSSRYELQRALGFIGSEIQMAESVNPCPPDFSGVSITASGSANPYPVLSLTMPIKSGLTEPIIYYVAALPAKSPWSGPLAIYRWGPTLNLDGTYSQGSSATSYSYYNEVVIDKITSDQLSNNCDAVFTAAIPANFSQGFSACAEPSGTAVKLAVTRNSDRSQHISLDAVFSRRSRGVLTTAPICPQ